MDDKNFNQTQYNTNAQAYIDSNLDGGIGGKTPNDRVTFLQEYLPTNSSIFEVGAGVGIDSVALTEAGYKVTASDFSNAFLEILKSKNIKAEYFDILNDTPDSNNNCIYANAVFVHISPNDLKEFLVRCRNKLSKGTILFATFLKGVGSERSSRGRGFERDFYYYEEDTINELVSDSDLEVKQITTIEDKWIWLVAKF